MDPFRDEIEQAQFVKQWIRTYAPSIVGGVALGLSALYGWNAWQDYQHGRAVNAAAFFTALEALADTDTAAAIRQGQGLIADFPDTPYAVDAALLLARMHTEENNLPAAETQLRWAVENARPPEIAHVARLRLARVINALGRSDEALATLEGVDPQGYASSYAELRGDILSKSGDTAGARSAYQQALNEMDADGGDRALLQMKLDNLAAPNEDTDTLEASE
jgi:predicted negative regulator of RcsB-dependent stress response